MPLNTQNLTIKQADTERPIDRRDIFCLHYLQTFDATESWKKATPKSKTKHPQQCASRYLNDPKTQERLREIAASLITDMEQEVRDIIEETKRIVSFNPMDIMRIEDGRPVLDLSKADESTLRMLNIRFSSTVDKDGGIHHLYDIKPKDAMDALEKLYKYHKLYAASGDNQPNRVIQVNVGFPIPGEHWRTGEPVPPDVIEYLDSNG